MPTKTEARAWQRMLSGRRLDLLDPSPLDVEIEDIAHGLSRVARWNGQTSGAWSFSVAQHCLLVENLAGRLKSGAPRSLRLAALLHDAPEYVIGDLITPFKAAVGLDYKELEERLLRAIHLRFGLPAVPAIAVQKLIKRADHAAAYLEAIQLAGFAEAEAAKIIGKPRALAPNRLKAPAPPRLKAPAPPRLKALPPGEAKARYLRRFAALIRKS